jgi:hypothetical protein
MNRLTNNELRRLANRCSRLWRLNNLYTITDKNGRRVVFKMNSAQEALYHAMHRQNVILKARQRGFTTFIQLIMLDACIFNEDVRAGTIAHTLPNAQVIFRDKVRFPYDQLPESIRNAVPARNDNSCELLLANNSSIRVGVLDCAPARCNTCTSPNTARSAQSFPRRRARCAPARSTPWTSAAWCSSKAPRKARTDTSSSCAKVRERGATPEPR